ncbi:MAG: SDR family NAD(P)-dependent oxidoreductase [Solirubrobacteraceae bacterium]
MEPDLGLAGLRAVVTGSTRGLGAAVARDLVSRGARVVLNGTDSELCGSLAAELGAVAVVGSVAEEQVADTLIATCVEAFGGIDLLVNNAGITRDGMLVKATVDQFDAVVAVNLRGTWLASRAAARAMRGSGGLIVNVVSGTALFGNVGQSVYAAAKGGVLSMTRTLALELQRSAIRVNAIAPVVRTEMVAPLLALEPGLGDSFGEPEAVAPVVALLASPAASELTGIVLGFDGSVLTSWSHPAAEESVAVAAPGDLEALTAALGQLPRLTPNPDQFGLSVLRALGAEPLRG